MEYEPPSSLFLLFCLSFISLFMCTHKKRPQTSTQAEVSVQSLWRSVTSINAQSCTNTIIGSDRFDAKAHWHRTIASEFALVLKTQVTNMIPDIVRE